MGDSAVSFTHTCMRDMSYMDNRLCSSVRKAYTDGDSDIDNTNISLPWRFDAHLLRCFHSFDSRLLLYAPHILDPLSTPLTISGYQNMIELTLASALITTVLLLLLQQRQLHRQAVRPRMVVRVQRQKRIRTRDEDQEEDESGWAIGARRLASRERQPLPLPIQRDDESGRFRRSRFVFGDDVPESQIARRVHGNGRVEMHGRVDVDCTTEDSLATFQHRDTRRPAPRPRITIIDSDATTEVPLDMQETRQEKSQNVGQQRALRVRFDEALRMHSFGGSQYIGRVMDKEYAVLQSPMDEKDQEGGVDKRNV